MEKKAKAQEEGKGENRLMEELTKATYETSAVLRDLANIEVV